MNTITTVKVVETTIPNTIPNHLLAFNASVEALELEFFHKILILIHNYSTPPKIKVAGGVCSLCGQPGHHKQTCGKETKYEFRTGRPNGRPKKYFTDAERQNARRKQVMDGYYRRKAAKLSQNLTVPVPVKTFSFLYDSDFWVFMWQPLSKKPISQSYLRTKEDLEDSLERSNWSLDNDTIFTSLDEFDQIAI